MSTYVIGDIQGCFRELQELLETIAFDPDRDRLWFTGDLVNRGPESLAALRFIRALDDLAVVVLGNHDLHLLAVAAGHACARAKDTLDEILAAPDRDELLHWLARRPLIHTDANSRNVLVHAGLAPQWKLKQSLRLAREVEAALQGTDAGAFLATMYGDQPDTWSDDLRGFDRLRFVTNCFTRIRFCTAGGRISLAEKGAPGEPSNAFMPWYAVPGRRTGKHTILFGHWSTVRLGQDQDFSACNVIPLDTGCVWGGALTAYRLDDGVFISVPSRQPRRW